MRRNKRITRNVDGILLLDKPLGLTSNAALQRVKRMFNASKAGHTGSLDPLATGMLPICLGKATKISGVLLEADKRYIGTARLGERTTTGDREGEVSATSDPSGLTLQDLEKVATRFVGRIQQIPPMYSAIKQGGRALYELARQGVEVERQAREVTIHELRITAFSGDQFEFDLRCSKGTYVRTLVEDIAAALDQCAHLKALRRMDLGGFSTEDMVTAEALETAVDEGGPEALDQYLLPMSSALSHWPGVTVDAARSFYLTRGQAVHIEGSPDAGPVAVYDLNGGVLALAEVDELGRIAPRRLLRSK